MWRGIGAVLQSWREGDFWIVAWFRWVAGELVVHWRGAFPGFRPVLGDFLGSQWSTRRSGPLARRFSWFLD